MGIYERKLDLDCRDRRPRLSVNTNKICSANLWDITNNPHDFDQIFRFYADSRGRLSLQIVPTFVRKHPLNKNLSVKTNHVIFNFTEREKLPYLTDRGAFTFYFAFSTIAVCVGKMISIQFFPFSG